ncbi:MAG: response regulator transcription factor [Bacteroidota bacterium]
MKNFIEIALTDDHADFRSLFAKQLIFESLGGIHIMLEAGNGAELLKGMRDQVPDIVLLDLHMPVMDGFETARILHALFPEVILVGVTNDIPEMRQAERTRLGFRAFIRKDQEIGDVVRTLRRIRQGEVVFQPDSTSLDPWRISAGYSLNALSQPLTMVY